MAIRTGPAIQAQKAAFRLMRPSCDLPLGVIRIPGPILPGAPRQTSLRQIFPRQISQCIPDG